MILRIIYQWLESLFIWQTWDNVAIELAGSYNARLSEREQNQNILERRDDQPLDRERAWEQGEDPAEDVIRFDDLDGEFDDEFNDEVLDELQEEIVNDLPDNNQGNAFENDDPVHREHVNNHFEDIAPFGRDEDLHPLVRAYQEAIREDIIYEGETDRYKVQLMNFGDVPGIDERVHFEMIRLEVVQDQQNVVVQHDERLRRWNEHRDEAVQGVVRERDNMPWQLSLSIADFGGNDNFDNAMPLVLPLLQEHQISEFRVVHREYRDRIRLNPVDGGRHLTIFSEGNREFEEDDWKALIQEVTTVLAENGIVPGPLPLIEDEFGRANRGFELEVQGSPYFSVRPGLGEANEDLVNPLENVQVEFDGQLPRRVPFPVAMNQNEQNENENVNNDENDHRLGPV